MITATLDDSTLRQAVEEGYDKFLSAIAAALLSACGGTLTPAVLPQLHSDQVTLLAYMTLREELLQGGFVQLIYNGYGPFIFVNPFAKALAQWGLSDLAALINKAHKLYNKHHHALAQPVADDDTFMALYEQYPAFDALDDHFVAHEEQYTAAIACYVDDHLATFVQVQN